MLAAIVNTEVLWRNALLAIPLALLVAGICRILPCRPSTRHLLWLVVLGALFIPPGVPRLSLPSPPVSREVSPAPAMPAEVAAASIEAPPPAVTPAESLLAAGSTTRIKPRVSAAQGTPRPRGASETSLALAPSRSSHPPAGAKPVAPSPSVNPFSPAPDPLAAVSSAPTGSPPAPRALADLFPPVDRPEAAPSRMPAFVPPTMPGPSPARPAPALAGQLRDLGATLIAPVVSRARQGLSVAEGALRTVASFPSLPSNLWLAGSIGLAVIAGGRALRHGRTLRRATPAPREVVEMVESAGADLGLRRVPQALMVRERLSPMIWCGRRARLVLPVELWDELDEPGRLAVLHHELAHLKRLDHWVCWAELIASAIYWWHPLVWFVRRRLREEADLCCDAWVTMTMPRSRRAYAEALLETRRFISESRAAPPAVGLGAISGRARHFARRLTMVMTQRMTPRRSVSGMMLALTVGAAGVLAAPLLACPPEEGKEKAKQTTVVRGFGLSQSGPVVQPPEPPEAPQAPRAPKPPKAPKAPKAPRAMSVPVQPTPAAPPAQPFARRGPSAAGAPTSPPGVYGGMGGTLQPGTPGMPPRGMGGGAGGFYTPAPAAGPGSRDLEQRLQRLEQRLDQLNRRMDQMMERLNRRGDAGETDPMPRLLGTTPLDLAPLTAVTVGELGDADKMVVVLVGPGDKVQAFHVGEEQIGGLRALLSANGQAVAVERRALEEHARALAERAQANAMRDFAAQHEAERAEAAPEGARAALNDRALRERHEALAAAEVARARDLAARAYTSAGARDALTKAHRERAQAQASKARDYERLAERLRERAETVTERADTLAERLAEVQESAESLSGKAREEHMKAAEKLREEIERLKEAVERIREQADEVSGQADELSSQADDEADEAAEAEESDADESSDDPEPAIASIISVAPIAVIGQTAPATAAPGCCETTAKSCNGAVATTAPVAALAAPAAACCNGALTTTAPTAVAAVPAPAAAPAPAPR